MTPDDSDDSPALPTITVCVPMYNNGASIARCLRSVLEQDGVDFEILVVDDNSSDDCAATAALMLRAGDRLISNESRLGLNANHNRCIQLARGEYIQFVHGDDWLLPGALRALAPCFNDPAVGLAFAPRRVLNDDIPWWWRTLSKPHIFFLKLRAYNRGPSLVSQMMLMGWGSNWIGEPTCVMFRRRLAVDVGCFREDIYQLVDLDLWLRLMLRSAVRFVPQQLSVRSQTPGTESIRNDSARLARPAAHSHVADRRPSVARGDSDHRDGVVAAYLASTERGGRGSRTTAVAALENLGPGSISRVHTCPEIPGRTFEPSHDKPLGSPNRPGAVDAN